MMKSISSKLCLLSAVACLALSGTAATAQNTASTTSKTTSALKTASDTESSGGPWLVRLRMVSMINANRSAPFTAAGVNFAPDSLHLSDKVLPEVDLSYFVTPHWAAELIATYPQDHAVSLSGLGPIGTVRHLPPTLMFQYHEHLKNSRLTPYIGLGVNFTWITSVNLKAAGIPLDVTRTSVGFAYQIGVDYDLGHHFSLNLDYKHINLNPDVKVKATETKLTNAQIDPDLLSLGIGYRF